MAREEGERNFSLSKTLDIGQDRRFVSGRLGPGHHWQDMSGRKDEEIVYDR